MSRLICCGSHKGILMQFRTGVVALFAAFGVLMSIEADR